MEDVSRWGLEAEEQIHNNPDKAYDNLIGNGATPEEATFISEGERVELNMLTGPQFIEFVTEKLDQHGVEKVIPDEGTLRAAWERAHLVQRINKLIADMYQQEKHKIPGLPDDLTERIRDDLDADPTQAWDEALWGIVGEEA